MRTGTSLRGRFAIALIAAALVPIAIATLVVVEDVAANLHAQYGSIRTHAERVVTHELARQTAHVAEVAEVLATRSYSFVDDVVRELTDGDSSRADTRRRWSEQADVTMRGARLDVLTLTGSDDVVLVSPHDRGKVGEVDRTAHQRAGVSAGKPFFARDTISTGHSVQTVLVVESARVLDRVGAPSVVVVGRRITDDVLASVRQPGVVDARLAMASGEVVLPPAGGDGSWPHMAGNAPVRIAMPGPDGTAVAYVELAISAPGIGPFVADVVAPALLLAFGALLAVVSLGIWITRRTTRDLERLVEAATAAARGELDYRVAVRSADEVGAVAKAFNFMMEDLQVAKDRLVIAERIAAWQDIARRLAHEIKNPLTPIQMAMDTLRKSWGKQHPQFAEILDESTATVLEEADRLKRIVAEFSDFARMPKPAFARMDLNDLVRSTVALYQGATPAVEAVLDPALPELIADKAQLGQVLFNLVENSREAVGSAVNGRIVITTRCGETPDRVVLIVEDNGPGIPAALRDKVFTPYFTTKAATGGSGLGLAIVHRIVADHGGRIAMSNSGSGGARVAIELPLRGGVMLLASRA